jgi:hypothetical protein
MTFISTLKKPELFRLADALEVVPQHGGKILKNELENAIQSWSFKRGFFMNQRVMYSQIFPFDELDQEALDNFKRIGDRKLEIKEQIRENKQKKVEHIKQFYQEEEDERFEDHEEDKEYENRFEKAIEEVKPPEIQLQEVEKSKEDKQEEHWEQELNTQFKISWRIHRNYKDLDDFLK